MKPVPTNCRYFFFVYPNMLAKNLANVEDKLDKETVRKLSVMCALTLYLDFVNLFLHLLRLMGRKK